MIRILNRALWILFLVLTPLTFVGILSQNSIPGDFLYSTKRSYEGVALAFASLVPETKASYTTSLATTRFDEAEKLILVKSDTQGLATLIEQVQTAQDNVAAVQSSPQKEELEQKLIASIDTYQENLSKVQQQVAANVPVQTAPTNQVAVVQQNPIQTTQQQITPTQAAGIPIVAQIQPSPTQTPAVQTSAPTQSPLQTSTPTPTKLPISTQNPTTTLPPQNTTTPDQRKKIDEEITKTKDKLDEIRKKVKEAQTIRNIPAASSPTRNAATPTPFVPTATPFVPTITSTAPNPNNENKTNNGGQTN